MNYNVAEERILDAALEVINEKTISNTRMHLIAQRAGMVQSNVHYYFRTKRELLLALLNRLQAMFTEYRQEYVDQRASTLPEKLRGFFQQKKQIILEHPEFDRAQFDFWCFGQTDQEVNSSFGESYDIWRAHILRVVDGYRPGLPTAQKEMVATVMVSMMMGASMQYLNKPESFDLDEYFELCLQMALNALDGPQLEK